MRARDFQTLARQMAGGATEAHWRAVAIHAYYALVLECREIQIGWGFGPKRRDAHADIRLRFRYATDMDLRFLGDELERLGKIRNLASYELNPHPLFHSVGVAAQVIRDVDAALALLDAIEADPIRRAAAIATIRP